jgi:hypothetical protein
VLKDFPLEFFVLHGLGRGRGFSLEPVEGGLLFTQLMEKISAVYNRFFGTRMEVAPFYPLTDMASFDTIHSRFLRSAVVKGFDEIGEI